MTRLKRRLIFYGLVIIFILITPPTILYAMGYSFDWQSKNMTQTGGLYLKSTPEGADITINGKNHKTTSRLISRLIPGTHTVEIHKDGFQSWKKNLLIEPTLVTEARNIILFPKSPAPESINKNATSTIEDILTSPAEKQSRSLARDIASSTAGWLNRDSDIFYIDRVNFILYRRDFGGFIKEQLSKESLPEAAYAIVDGGNNRFLVLDDKGTLYLLNKDTGIFGKIFDRVQNAAFSGDNKKILILTPNETWILYLEDILIQPYKKAGEKELVTRFGQPIRQAIFYPDNEHITFVVGDQIKITELDGRDSRNTVDFISAPSPQIYFDEPNGYFYYLTENEIFRVRLKL